MEDKRKHLLNYRELHLITLLLYLFCGQSVGCPQHVANVERNRNALMNIEAQAMLGNDLILTEKEKLVNKYITDLKNQIQDECSNAGTNCFYNRHFFNYKDDVTRQPLFKVIKDMPKGGLLHVHDIGILSPDYVVSLTYLDNLYICQADEGTTFKFSKSIPSDACSVHWKLVNDARRDSGDTAAFDASLRKLFTIFVDNPEEVYASYDTLWSIFQNYFFTATPLLSYKPVWEQYFYDAMKSIRAENIMYLEVRSFLPDLYDLDGNLYDAIATAETLKQVSAQFVADYPDFVGMKLIYAPTRNTTYSTVQNYLTIARKLKNVMPEFFAGFDLADKEESMPLKAFLPLLEDAADEIDYFFHSGETSWNGYDVDENLFDAIALGAKRIGHAYALPKHPLLFEAVKKNRIPIEANPISSSIPILNKDTRNDPLAVFLANGMEVSLSSDDPGVWESDPLNYDFFIAFVSIANQQADLRLLKKLAYNSLNHSSISNKAEVVARFDERWGEFIDLMIERIALNYYQ